jgi:osmotically-inducible protein OsmY
MSKRNPAAALAGSLWLGLSVSLALGLGACTSAPSQPPAQEVIEDGVVTAKVKQALVADPITKAHNITVETFKGQVQLGGYVETDEARTRALQVARDVQGVRKVTDAMQVRTPQG